MDYEDGHSTKRQVANAHAHGRWLEWLDDSQGEEGAF
jgi:hypothetical protein